MSPDAAALPPHGPLLTTPTGAEVLAFTTPGEHALDWWQRLRDTHPATGYWPLLLDDEAPEYFADGYEYESPADARTRLATLDGATLLADRWAADLRIYGPELTAEINADLNGDRDWPENPERRGSGFGPGDEVTVALVPAPAGWMVPAAPLNGSLLRRCLSRLAAQAVALIASVNAWERCSKLRYCP